MFLSPLGMPAWHSSSLSRGISGLLNITGQMSSGDEPSWWRQFTESAFGRMLKWLHSGNVLFLCQTCAGNRNQSSHNNDTFTWWPIRCQLHEISLGNLCVYVANSAREAVVKKNGLDTIIFTIMVQITAAMIVSAHSWGRWLRPVTGWDDVMSTWRQRPVSVWCELPVGAVSTLSGGWAEA